MIYGLQFIAIIFSLIMLYVSYLHFKKKTLSPVEWIFLVWFGL